MSPQSALSEPVTLNLFDDVSLTTVFDTVEDHELTDNGFVWIGHIDGHAEDSETVLVVGDGQMAGYVRTLGKLYQIAYAGNGVHAINEISEEAFVARHIHPIVPEGIETLDDPGVAPQTVSASGYAQIDLMVLYTARTRNGFGSDYATRNAIQLAVAAVNQAYVNSDVNARIRLVYTGFVDYNETYGDCNVECTDIENVQQGKKGLANVANLRNTYGADVVTLITNNAPAYCGIAYQMAGAGNPSTNFEVWAFNIVWSQCLAGGRTLAHEIGHNMGAAHNYEDRALNVGLYSDSYGYWSPAGEIRTIMSYYNCPPSSACASISRFSSPYHTFGGVALGDDNANNVRTLNITAPIVASFRSPNAVDVEPTATPALPTATPYPDVTSPEPTELPACTASPTDTITFRNAITIANGNGPSIDVICLTVGGLYEVVNSAGVSSAFPRIESPIIILGNGATIRRIGVNSIRFFYVQSSGNLSLHNLTLEDGRQASGGAIYNNGGTVTLDQTTLIGNTATGYGGAIYNAFGTVLIGQSTLRNNMTYASGGAIYMNEGELHISHSDLVGNSAYYGGVLLAFDSEFTIRYSNMVENSADFGAVVYASSSSALQEIRHSCLTGNSPVAIESAITSQVVDARVNWWGSTLGPNLTTPPTPSPPTTSDRGDYIGDRVTYAPYQQMPYNFCPPRPVLTEPADNTLFNVDDVGFEWDIEAYEATFEFEMASDSDFETMVYSQMVGTAESLLLPDLDDNIYYWRVRGYNDTNPEYSAVSNGRMFEVDTTPPDAPILIAPQNGMETTNQRPLFSWNYNGDVALYEFSLTGPGMVDPITTPYTSYNFDGPLLPNRDDIEYPYSWRVRAQDTAGNWSDWSETRTFEIDSEEGAAPELTLYTSVDFTLTWGEITWAQAYHLQIAYDEDFDYLMLNHDSLASDETSLVIEGMRLGRYYWRVRAQNEKGVWSKWSTDSFWVADGDPMNP